jgi:hypothetical protein
MFQLSRTRVTLTTTASEVIEQQLQHAPTATGRPPGTPKQATADRSAGLLLRGALTMKIRNLLRQQLTPSFPKTERLELVRVECRQEKAGEGMSELSELITWLTPARNLRVITSRTRGAGINNRDWKPASNEAISPSWFTGTGNARRVGRVKRNHCGDLLPKGAGRDAHCTLAWPLFF